MKMRLLLGLAWFGLGCLTAGGARSETPSGPAATWSLAAVGDAIITRRITPFDNDRDPRFQRLAKLIRGADAAFVNLEVSLFRLSEFKGWPEVENGGNWELGPPEAAAELKTLGFSLFNRANNHTTDYGVAGMRATDRLLDRLGLAHAGTGDNLGQASRPAYLDTAKGRVALIGFATTFTPMSRAGAARPDIMGRPGLNALRVNRKYEAEAPTLRLLGTIAEAFGGRKPDGPNAPVHVFGITVEPGTRNGMVETIDERDAERILREIRNAAKQADFVVVGVHSHQPGRDAPAPPPWMIEFSRKCIDAGATAFINSGPHQLRGIEIYRGRPIFYSLGNFIFQNETIDPMPSDAYERFNLPDTALPSDVYDARFKGGTSGFPSGSVWYESVVALATFRGKELTELRLHPIDLGQKQPRSQRGTPRLAEGEIAQKIIGRLSERSAAFGTTIASENGVGVWRAAPRRTEE